MSNVFRQGVFDFTQGADFGFEGFVFSFFAGEVVAREGGAVFDACGGEQVGDFAELAFFALEVFDFDETLFDECGDQVVGFAFAHAQQGGEFALGDVGVLFNRSQNSKVDLLAGFHGLAGCMLLKSGRTIQGKRIGGKGFGALGFLADDDARGVEVVVEGAAFAEEFGGKKQVN